MKKNILIVDFLLLLVFIAILFSRITNFTYIQQVQLLFFALIVIHIIQHWKIILFSFKKYLLKK